MNIQNQTAYQDQANGAIKRMLRLVLVVCAIGYGLYAFVIAPICVQLTTDVAYQNSWLAIVLDFIIHAGLIELAVFYLTYPAVIYAIWRGGLSKAYKVPLFFVLLTLGKYMVNFFMTCLTDGGFPGWELFWEEDFSQIFIPFFLEILQFGLVVLFAVWVRRSRINRARENAEIYRKPQPDERALAFPMTKLLSYRNPVQWSAFFFAVVILLGRWFMHGIYQFTLLVYNGYTDGGLIIAIDFVSDFLIAAVAYFVAVLLLSYFDRKDMERLATVSHAD